MAIQNKTTKVSKAFGRDLTDYEGVTTPEITVSYEYDALGAVADIPEDEKLEDEDILGVVNARRNAAARATAVNQALANLGIKQPALSNEEKAFNGIVRSLILLGNSEADAKALASQMVGK